MQHNQLLEYGFVSRKGPRQLLMRGVPIALMLLLSVWAIRIVCRQIYYYDQNRVRALLASIARDQIVTIRGFDDGITWTVAYAEIHLNHGSNQTIGLLSPRGGELQSGSRMRIARLGEHDLVVDVGDERMLIQYLDVGRDSEFRDVLPFKLGNIADLSAHYDEILTFVQSEPSGTYTTSEGRSCTYHIRVMGGKGTGRKR